MHEETDAQPFDLEAALALAPGRREGSTKDTDELCSKPMAVVAIVTIVRIIIVMVLSNNNNNSNFDNVNSRNSDSSNTLWYLTSIIGGIPAKVARSLPRRQRF